MFRDASGDGIGDLDGIVEKLDHLAGAPGSLGVNTVLLAPIYPSDDTPGNGNITDMEGIDPAFGDLAAFDRLIAAARERGLHIALGICPARTSVTHPWFQASRSKASDPKRNWYIWHKARIKGIPPTNWLDEHGAPAWKFDPLSGDYYLSGRGTGAADLNWRHGEVRDAMFAAMRSWIERGVRGFVSEGSSPLLKDPSFQNDPANPNYDPDTDPPSARYLRVHSSYVRPLETGQTFCEAFGRNRLPGGHDVFMCVPDIERMFVPCTEPSHSPFIVRLSRVPWNAAHYRHFIDAIEVSASSPGTIIYTFTAKETLRPATLLGPHRARLVPLLLMTLRGTPLITYGDEIAMENISDISASGHDLRWTPMQWDPSPYAGFSRTAPPGPIVSDYRKRNVAAQTSSPRSMLALYRTLIGLRKRTAALSIGSYLSLDTGMQPVLAYVRQHENEKFLVAMNFSPAFQLISFRYPSGKLVMTTELDHETGTPVDPRALPLRPYEGCVIRLS